MAIGLLFYASSACGQRRPSVLDSVLIRMDSVEIGLVTCSPHDEVYSLYGHTALDYHDLRTHRHWMFNWGVFDAKKPHFVWHFMMGETDYWLETWSLTSFCGMYRRWGSSVKELVLDLTREEKQRITEALGRNLESPYYRYNVFYDNCATRPRDLIERCLDGSVAYAPRPDYTPTLRQIVHQQTQGHPWAAFGNDLLLGLKADFATTQRDRQFLPDNLMQDFAHATVDRHGEKRPLVKREVLLVPLGQQPHKKGFPLSPLACTLLLLGLSIVIFIIELRKRRVFVWWDALLMAATGLAGCILLLMVFSDHPTTGLNLQLLVLCPLSLLFILQVLRRRRTWWFTISMVMVLAFYVGGIWQDYAEGMELVALCLLSRYWIHRNDK